MRVIESDFFNDALRYIGYACGYGWHERNAGNISLRLNNAEIESIFDDLKFVNAWVKLPEVIKDMANEYVFTTVSGTYFIDIHNDPQTKFCICQISEQGDAYRVVWGGLKPTSELTGHLLSLEELKKRKSGRAVYHCHPSNVVALSYILKNDDETISNALWESETECAFVFPDGIGVVGFYVPGSYELAKATAEKMKRYNAVLWSFHGIFASGDSIATAFGLVSAIEKAADIKLKVLSSGLYVKNTITPEQLKKTATAFGFELNDFNEKTSND